ncbi:MAG: hypothetical protein GF320_12955, partial [Armatimonadia bacterium]|nr:hypothetical protein [Armatimonadia bacterium]
MPRRIQPVMTRRPQPRWVQILLTAGIVLGLLYFFLGDTIQAVIDRYRDAETEDVRMVQI